VVGPQIALNVQTLFSATFSGVYFVMCMIDIFIFFVQFFITFSDKPFLEAKVPATRPLKTIIGQSDVIFSIVIQSIAYATMLVIMSVVPLVMRNLCSYNFNDTTNVLMIHVLGMFGLSAVTPIIVGKIGLYIPMLCGGALMIAGTSILLAGIGGIPIFYVGMVFVGMGWNLTFLPATSIVTLNYENDNYRQKINVQGFNDMCVFLTVMVFSITCSFILKVIGWINYLYLYQGCQIGNFLIIVTFVFRKYKEIGNEIFVPTKSLKTQVEIRAGAAERIPVQESSCA